MVSGTFGPARLENVVHASGASVGSESSALPVAKGRDLTPFGRNPMRSSYRNALSAPINGALPSLASTSQRSLSEEWLKAQTYRSPGRAVSWTRT